MSLFTSMPQTIYSALQNVMGSVTLRRDTPGAYNPATGTVGAGTTQAWAAKGLVEDYSPGSLQKSLLFLDAATVKPGDRKCTLLSYDLGTAPVPGDNIIAGGRAHKIVSVAADPSCSVWEMLVR